jgi:ankyrin repeat protein
MIAAVDGKLALAKALVENGVSPNTSGGGSTALEMACSNGRTDVAKYLLSKGAVISNALSCAPMFSTRRP